jgi:hypothetical protein
MHRSNKAEQPSLHPRSVLHKIASMGILPDYILHSSLRQRRPPRASSIRPPFAAACTNGQTGPRWWCCNPATTITGSRPCFELGAGAQTLSPHARHNTHDSIRSDFSRRRPGLILFLEVALVACLAMELVHQVVNLIAGSFDLVAGIFDLTAVEVALVAGRWIWWRWRLICSLGVLALAARTSERAWPAAGGSHEGRWRQRERRIAGRGAVLCSKAEPKRN